MKIDLDKLLTEKVQATTYTYNLNSIIKRKYKNHKQQKTKPEWYRRRTSRKYYKWQIEKKLPKGNVETIIKQKHNIKILRVESERQIACSYKKHAQKY